ncbi:MAG: hypothetical protein QM736_06510 [Vicinamibacterales bacterium]
MAGKRRVNIIFSDNGSGLSRDAVVLRDALERTGHAPSLSPLAPRKYPWAINYIPEIAQHAVRETIQVLQRSVARRTRLWDINIFLERLVPEYLRHGRRQLPLSSSGVVDGGRQAPAA